jgi:hypothetical protein
MIPLRLELRTACVLDRSDNQLHHRTNLMERLPILAIILRVAMTRSRSKYQQSSRAQRMAGIGASSGRKGQQSRIVLRMCTAVIGEVSAVLTHSSAYSIDALTTLAKQYT